MIEYATKSDLARWLDPDSPDPVEPPLASVLVRSASALVGDVIAAAVYATSPDGTPSDARLRTAVREATCEQAAAWSLHNIDPRKGATSGPKRVASKSMGGTSITYATDAGADAALSALVSGRVLVSSARLILEQAGLTSSAITTDGSARRHWPAVLDVS
jgi:hypothetical protein